MAEKEQKFYEITNERKVVQFHDGEPIKLWRIRNLETGELGGWVRDKYCLRQDGSWVGEDAMVIRGCVSGKSEVRDEAVVNANGGYVTNGSVVKEKAFVSGNLDNSVVEGCASVCGFAKCKDSTISGEARIECYHYGQMDGGLEIINAKVSGNAAIRGERIKIVGKGEEGIMIGGEAEIHSGVHIYGNDVTINTGEFYTRSPSGRGEW